MPNEKKQKTKAMKKVRRWFPIAVGMFPLAIVIVGVIAIYTVSRDLFTKTATETGTYKSSASMDIEKGIVTQITNDDGTTTDITAADIMEKLDGLEDFLKDDKESTKEQKLEYLMNAELVSKFPYIDTLDGDESKLNGIIRFYRYTDQVEVEEAEKEGWEWEQDTPSNQENPAPNEPNAIDVSKIFYIGDSWMVGLKEYLRTYVTQEFPGEGNFLCDVGLGARDSKYSDDNLKNYIDAVNPSAVVIMLGLNDRTESAADRMKGIIDLLSNRYSDKTIYVLKVPHVGKSYKNETYNYDATKINGEIDQYNQILLQHCSSKTNVKYIDSTNNMIADGYLSEEYVEADGLHLNSAGKSMWYQNIKDCIEKGKNSTNVSKFRMKYINNEEFEELCRQYEESGYKEVFKYYTMDEEQNVVIAYGSQSTRTITTDDPEVTLDVINERSTEVYAGENGAYSTIKYNIYTKPIDYKTLVEPYIMPFNLLAAFLIQTGDYELTAEIAALAYDSKICIGIYDNQTITVKNDSYSYNKSVRYTENTVLNFDNIDRININDSRYSNVQKKCYGSIIGDNNVFHSKERNDVNTNNRQDGKLYKTLITEISEDGIITGVTEEQEGYLFNTNYNMMTISNSVPSVGVVLADVWVGKWEVSYTQKDNNSSASSSEGNEDDETYISIEKEKFSEEVLDPKSGVIGVNLTKHSDQLKEDAIKEIVNNTEFETSLREMTADDIINCAAICSACSRALDGTFSGGASWKRGDVHYIGDEALRDAVRNAGNSGNSLNHVKAHVTQLLTDEAKSKNAKKIENFKGYLEDEKRITCDQWPTAKKANINISFATTTTRTSTTYEKDTIERENEGLKFKQIITKSKYHDAKKHILDRTDWFWEYIRYAEDTAKLENLIRYMFNIAFDTDTFGTLTDEEIENLFKVFEPQDLKRAGRIYGNTIQEKVWFSLIREGYSEYAVAGVMGCIYSESKFDPAIIESDTGIGFGLCQWSFDRRENLEEYAASKNVDPSDVPTQIEFLITELLTDGSGPASGYATCGFSEYKRYTREDWLNAETPEDAAIAFCWSFERPGDDANVIERQTMAQQYYEEFQGRSLIANDVVEFALQWEDYQAKDIQPIDGDLPDGLFSYRTSDGVQFYLQQWCADFVSFCFDQCGQIDSIGGTFQAPWRRIEQLKNGTINGIFIEGGEVPEPGDIFLTEGHTGIVVEVQGDTLVTIEGNCGGIGSGDSHSSTSYVKKYSYRTIYDSDIIGYQRPM